MMAKHPLDSIKKPLRKDEIAQALRYAMIAELDAINMYLQIAEAIEDEKIKEVFKDIAREEKTHFGEFLAVLKELDPELVEEIQKGGEEVVEIFEKE